MGPSASIFYKCSASLISQEKNRPCCQVISWMRSLLRFSFWEQPSWQSARVSRSACLFSDVDSDRIVLSMAKGHVSVEWLSYACLLINYYSMTVLFWSTTFCIYTWQCACVPSLFNGFWTLLSRTFAMYSMFTHVSTHSHAHWCWLLLTLATNMTKVCGLAQIT